MQPQPAPSQEEGVPPAAVTAAREAQEPPVAEQPAPAPTPTAAPLKTNLCAELELMLAMVKAAGPEIDLAAAMVHVSRHRWPFPLPSVQPRLS